MKAAIVVLKRIGHLTSILTLVTTFGCGRPQGDPGGTAASTPLPPASQASGGSIQGGGGGTFTLSVFWALVRQVETSLQDDTFTNVLSADQLKSVRSLMQKGVVRIEYGVPPLFVVNKDGKRVKVDAINYPNDKKIVIDQKAWDQNFTSGLEMRHLVLHEFLGLAGIDDSEYRISQRYFPPGLTEIPYDMNKLNCSLSYTMGFRLKPDFYIDSGDKSFEVSFGKSTSVAKQGEKFCVKQGKDQAICGQKGLSSQAKLAEFHQLLDWNRPEDTKLTQYAVHGWVQLTNGSYSYGSGAASKERFYEPGSLTLIAKLIISENGHWRDIALSQTVLQRFQAKKQISVDVDLLHPAALAKITEQGLPFKTADNAPAGSDVLGRYNLWPLLMEIAKAKGVKNEKDARRFFGENLFSSLPENFPFSANVGCYLSK